MSDGNIIVSCDGFDPGDLQLRDMRGHEELGRMFHFDVQVLHLDHEIAFKRFIGKTLSLKVPAWASLSRGGKTEGAKPKDEFRYFNGIIVNASYGGSHGRYASYQLAIAPKLWLTTLTSNCRIFQRKSVPVIVREVLQKHGITGDDYDDSKLGSYTDKDFVVQYRETDFNFVSRLLEQEGIYYFFTHSKTGHKMRLFDDPSSHKPVSGLETIPYLPPSGARVTGGETIRAWSVTSRASSHKFVHDDFDFKQPKSELRSTAQANNAMVKGEIYDYPGEFVYDVDGVSEAKEGERYARIRLQELRALETVAYGETTTISLHAGASFKFDPGTGHARKEDAKKYTLQSVDYFIAGSVAESGAGGADADSWTTRFVAIDSSVHFRPARITPKPLISGPQTAIVVGKSGDEIHTDKFGRVKLKFHWDRDPKQNEESSCWVRVAQLWAGKKWGAVFLPRVGHEVIVEFLEGDPDQPLITGRVYNGENMPPYELPSDATQSGIKSRSSKQGGVADFNELRFEDKKGEEQVYLHAQKDMKTVVEKDDFLEVGKNQKITIKSNLDETVEEGNHTLTIAAGKSVYEAKQSILLKVGQSSVLIDNSGVTIKGATVKIEGTTMLDQKAPMTTIKGDATVTITGGIVKIN